MPFEGSCINFPLLPFLIYFKTRIPYFFSIEKDLPFLVTSVSSFPIFNLIITVPFLLTFKIVTFSFLNKLAIDISLFLSNIKSPNFSKFQKCGSNPFVLLLQCLFLSPPHIPALKLFSQVSGALSQGQGSFMVPHPHWGLWKTLTTCLLLKNLFSEHLCGLVG